MRNYYCKVTGVTHCTKQQQQQNKHINTESYEDNVTKT